VPSDAWHLHPLCSYNSWPIAGDPQALAVVARLGIADELAHGPVAVAELARATETNEDALRRILRALARDGVFAELTPGTFANNALSEVLKSDHPNSMRHTVIQTMGTWNNACWDRLEDSVQTAEPVMTKLFGKARQKTSCASSTGSAWSSSTRSAPWATPYHWCSIAHTR
jgi:hypothetical protein